MAWLTLHVAESLAALLGGIKVVDTLLLNMAIYLGGDEVLAVQERGQNARALVGARPHHVANAPVTVGHALEVDHAGIGLFCDDAQGHW